METDSVMLGVMPATALVADPLFSRSGSASAGLGEARYPDDLGIGKEPAAGTNESPGSGRFCVRMELQEGRIQ